MRQSITKDSPNRQYVKLAAAFDFFNRRLFGGRLQPVIITLQRKAGTHGYYSSKRFEDRDDPERETDEIALNPGTFSTRSDRDILSTLVHEMVHHWQHHFGDPGRGRYHNLEWAEKMESVGLVPSTTGVVGGQRTGQRMTHYTVTGSDFDLACQELLDGGIRLEWQSREGDSVSKGTGRNSKVKYTCPECGVNVWGKPGLAGKIVCVDGRQPFVEAG